MLRALLLCAVSLSAATVQEIAKLPNGCFPVKFLTAEFGWCDGAGGPKVTDNGGRTWSTIPKPPERRGAKDLMRFAYPIRIEFLTPRQAWATNHDELFMTEDRGETWVERSLPADLHHLVFVTLEVGFATAWQGTPGPGIGARAAVFRTTDGGRTWLLQRYANRKTYRDLRGGLGWLEFADAGHGLSVELDDMYFTRDGGVTWKRSTFCPAFRRELETWIGSDMWGGIGVQLLDAQHGWWTVNGDTFRTIDGGGTWCPVTPIGLRGRKMSISKLHFATRDIGWVELAQRGFPDHLPLFETRDGGRTWKPIDLPGEFYSVKFASESVIYLAHEGKLYRLTRD
jgi:photosystem II stability/assembly factor-like uncharacterized protein